MYLTYDEYTGLGGTLDDTTFSNLAYEAEVAINYATFDRLKEWKREELPEAVKRCMYAIIDTMHRQEKSLVLGDDGDGNKSIKSQSNDGVSITYNGMSSTDLYTLCEKKIQSIIKTYLYGVKDSKKHPILYRGLYRHE